MSILPKAKVSVILFIFKILIDPLLLRVNVETGLFCSGIVFGPGTKTMSFKTNTETKYGPLFQNR